MVHISQRSLFRAASSGIAARQQNLVSDQLDARALLGRGLRSFTVVSAGDTFGRFSFACEHSVRFGKPRLSIIVKTCEALVDWHGDCNVTVRRCETGRCDSGGLLVWAGIKHGGLYD